MSIQAIKDFIKQTFTEPNNKTACVVRVMGVYTMVQGNVLAAYHVMVQHAPFDYQAYALGSTAMIAGLGVALGMKKDSQ